MMNLFPSIVGKSIQVDWVFFSSFYSFTFLLFWCAQYAINKEDGRVFYYAREIIRNSNVSVSQSGAYVTVDLELWC